MSVARLATVRRSGDHDQAPVCFAFGLARPRFGDVGQGDFLVVQGQTSGLDILGYHAQGIRSLTVVFLAAPAAAAAEPRRTA